MRCVTCGAFLPLPPNQRYHEALDMYRRVGLISALPLLSNDPAVRAYGGAAIALASAVYFREAQPYRVAFTNVLGTIAQYQILLVRKARGPRMRNRGEIIATHRHKNTHTSKNMQGLFIGLGAFDMHGGRACLRAWTGVRIFLLLNPENVCFFYKTLKLCRFFCARWC